MKEDLLQTGMHGAFVQDGYGLPLQGDHVSTVLAGVRLAAKDIFDVAGATCGAGNPDWKKTQAVATSTAPAIQWLLDAGASWVGKTVTDELTYSLAGINAHYGTPTNPVAPLRVPGGSSSGSVVSVAAGDADIALGSDCAGSIRLPSSYCGVWGIRTSHGRVSGKGCLTLAHSFDTIGLFAREGALLQKATGVLLGSAPATIPAMTDKKLIVSEDLCAQLDETVKKAFFETLRQSSIAYELLPLGTLDLASWANAFRILQGAEIWQQYRHWITTSSPVFGPDVAARFEQTSHITPAQITEAQQVRVKVHAQVTAILDGAMIITPPVPGPAIPLDASAETVDATRGKSFRMLCMAGLAGLPQVVMPWQKFDGAPVGLSLIGQRYSDEQLLAATIAVSKAIQ